MKIRQVGATWFWASIVTHPGHTGQVYAKQLIAHTVNNIFGRDKTACLQVVENNAGVKLYKNQDLQQDEN